MGRRRARRRAQRERKRHPTERKTSGPLTRMSVGSAGLLAAFGGVALLIHASGVNENRIARIAGILIVLGLAAAAAAVFRWI